MKQLRERGKVTVTVALCFNVRRQRIRTRPRHLPRRYVLRARRDFLCACLVHTGVCLYLLETKNLIYPVVTFLALQECVWLSHFISILD
jgi:hypothetical protein